MFFEINPAYLVATIFFITSGSYTVLSVVTYTGNIDTGPQRDYLATGAYLVLFSLFYGLMTIAGNETAFSIFWALGYIAGFTFFPGWALFLANKSYPNNKPVRHTLVAIFFLTLLISILCVLSDEVKMIETVIGNQFSYHGSMIFKVAFIHLSLLAMLLFYFQFKWWQKAKMTRYRREVMVFITFSVFVFPIGFLTDFILPTFTEFTFIPLGSICILAASIPTYISMRKNKTLSIEVKNLSGHIFKSVTLPILLIDHNNIIKRENESAADFFGRSVIGENIADIVLIDGKSPKQSFFKDSFSSETITAKTQDSERLCEMLLTVEKDKYGDALCKVIVISDLTEILLTLEQANDANKAKSAFLSNVGNRLRTPMNEISDGIDKLLKDHQYLSEAGEKLVSIHNSCDSLLGITNDILDFSDIEADKMEIIPVIYNVGEMVNESVESNKLISCDKNVEFELQIDEDIPAKLKGDQLRIRQILDKLLSNAYQFTDTGEITLSVFTEPGRGYGEITLVLSVQDTGVGMSKEQISKYFGEYSRFNIQENISPEGTGLGLAITRSLVNLMNGEIRMESEPGKGSFVLVRLPQEIADHEAKDYS